MPPSDLIDLARGHPDPALLPAARLARAAATLPGDPRAPAALGYGAEPGDADTRAAIAALIGREEGRPVDPDRLFVTGGASQALELICSRFAEPGDTVLAVHPTYHLALGVFADRGLRVRGVASDAEGLDPAALDTALAAAEAAGERVRLLYLVPTYANPHGATLSAARAERLRATARQRGFTVVADDVYRLLRFGAPPPPSPAASGAPEVLALGSFSKILAPGLRLGWIEGDPAALARLEATGFVQSGGGLAPLGGALAARLIDAGEMDDHLAWLRRTYAERAAALAGALAARFPEGAFGRPEGGYFVWLRLEGADAAALLPRAEAAGVRYVPGARFAVPAAANATSDRARLSFSFADPAALARGAERLADLLGS